MLAQKSLAFNLRNTNFCELFPDIVSEIKQRLQGSKAELAASKSTSGSAKSANGQANGSVVATDSHSQNASSANEQPATDPCATDGLVVGAAAAGVDLGSGGHGALKNCARNSYLNWQSIYSNLVIVICFAIFALIVNYVIKNLNQE